jgi:hypothetical protein
MTQELEARALWHLELEERARWREGADLDDDADDAYLGEAVTCWGCGGEGIDITCMDDLCHGQGWCMHGDGERPCPQCGGKGVL